MMPDAPGSVGHVGSALVSTPILEMRGISKRFGDFVALDSVDFSVLPGEVHALLGQNGAGKSTLMKILAGVYPLEEGELRINGGQPTRFSHPRDALRAGIGTAYQDLSLVPHLSVADNMFLGRELGNPRIINESAIIGKAAAILTELGITHINPKQRVSDLPLTQQRLVEVAKVLSYEPRILVLDEPTAALAEDATNLLFRLVDNLRARGIAIIFISHRFKEVLHHCDRATILRNGQLVKTVQLNMTNEAELIELTIGEKTETFFSRQQHEANEPDRDQIALEVKGFSVGRSVRQVSFKLKRGEIVGMTGLLGAGQNELSRALFGLQPEVSGVIRCKGQPVLITSPKKAIGLGIALLTDNRKLEGLIPDMAVRENVTLPSLAFFRRAMIFIDRRREKQKAQQFIEQLRVQTPSVNARIGTLSGGNQQKAILARWLLRDLDILIFVSPTQGIDVGAKAEIYEHLADLARQGKAILAVSEDSVEILGISDRILVMYQGQLTQEISRAEATEELLLSAIQGNRLPNGENDPSAQGNRNDAHTS